MTLFLPESLSSYGDLWERSLGENGYMYDWVPLLFIWNCQHCDNIVKLYFDANQISEIYVFSFSEELWLNKPRLILKNKPLRDKEIHEQMHHRRNQAKITKTFIQYVQWISADHVTKVADLDCWQISKCFYS